MRRSLHLPETVISYERTRGNPTITYLHGTGTNSSALGHQRAYVERLGFGSIAPDQRGDGASCGPDQERQYTLAAYTDDLESLLSHESVSRTSIVGHSLGGLVGLSYAARKPQAVDALVLVSTALNPGKAFGQRSGLHRLVLAHSRMLRECLRPLNWTGRFLPQSGERPDYTDDLYRTMSDVKFLFDQYTRIEPDRVSQLHALCNASTTFDVEELAPHVRAPTLIIGAKDDTIISERAVYELAEAVPNAVGPVFVEGRHGAVFQNPAPINEAIAAFLEDIYGSLPVDP